MCACACTFLLIDDKVKFRKRPVLKTSEVPTHNSRGDLIDSSSSEEAESEIKKVTSPEDKKQRQRYVVIKGILESEEAYVNCLDVILQYMRSLEGAANSSSTHSLARQSTLKDSPLPVISNEDIHDIFYNTDKIYQIHKQFVTSLRERVDAWQPMQTVGDLFKILISRFPTFTEYIKHYQTSVECIHRCSNENPAFKDLVSCIRVPNSTEALSLEEILFKPVQRIQRNTLVLHDLMKCTPPDHPDHNQLEKTLHLSKHSLGEFDTNFGLSNRNENERRLARNAFAVELVGGVRKLRYVFLFSDVFVCTKRKLTSRNKCNFEVKWFIPLCHLSVDRNVETGETIHERINVDELKRKVSEMRMELRREIRHDKAAQKRWLNNNQRNIDKLRKKLEEQEAQLVLSSPNLPFKLFHKEHKGFTLLMSSDYEREEWSESINQQRGRWNTKSYPSGFDIHNIIEQVKQTPKVNNIGSVLLEIGSDDDVWNGVLNVTIDKLSGLNEPSDTYCCLELDSYGHFFMKARTKVCTLTETPEWCEDFELDLDGSQTLRILCYKIAPNGGQHTIIGRSALELSKSWLTEKFQDMLISMNDVSLSISIRHTSAAKTMKRQPSRLKNGLFGVKISNVLKRERKEIPTIVTACCEEIEKRGMDELGIYRVSGVTSDVQKLKRSFEKNSRAAAVCLENYDIHAVSSVLKLYFRELPEPIFTEAQYPHFITTMDLGDPEAKERCMISLLHEVPKANFSTIHYLLQHLVKVSKDEEVHKMNCNNLATIFGPNLLRPGIKGTIDQTQTIVEQMFASAQEAFFQTSVLLYFLELYKRGTDLTKRREQSANF